MPWKARRLDPTEKENEQLRMELIQLRRELENKQGAVGRLELALHQRLETIDQLNARLEQSREQCRRLDQECESYFRMLQAG
jgi:chromosome segregation ATPase